MSIYVYALVEMQPRVAPRLGRGARREPIELSAIGRIGVLFGRVESTPPRSLAAVRAHDSVVRRAARTWAAVLPVRFGTLVVDEGALRALVRDRKKTLAEALVRVRDCAQMTVRVFGKSAARQADTDLADSAGGPGTIYLRKAAAEYARLQRLPEFDPVRRALDAYVRDERIEPHAAPPLIATVFHLIHRGDARRYTRRAVASARDSSLRIRVSGPFPPYAFAPEDL